MKNTDAIVKAIEDDNFVSFLVLAKDHDNLNTTAKNGMTPLTASVIFDRYMMFLELINNSKVDKDAVDKDGYDAMYHAVKNDRFVYQIVM